MSQEQLATHYEQLHPGAVADAAQKAERMERLIHQGRAPAPRRRLRQSGITVPALPWKEGR